jgi:ferritin
MNRPSKFARIQKFIETNRYTCKKNAQTIAQYALNQAQASEDREHTQTIAQYALNQAQASEDREHAQTLAQYALNQAQASDGRKGSGNGAPLFRF